MTIKVLIVEDMATYRSIIARSLSSIEGIEIVGKVSNGRKALDFIENNEVDLLTLDVEMPVMDGLATLKELRKNRSQLDVIMLSGLSDQAASLTIQCLQLGAIDFVLKPQTSSFVKNQAQLVESMKSIIANLSPKMRRGAPVRTAPGIRSRLKPITHTPPAPRPLPSVPRKVNKALVKPKVVVIGISTGGPKALAEVFEHLRGPVPFPILIVQHMPPKFTKSLADSLNNKKTVPVCEAMDGDVLQANQAYIAPGGYHMELMNDPDFGMLVGLNTEPPVNSCRPSVDVLFKSAAKFYRPGEIVSIVMTGMGRDGADGAEALNKAGQYVAIQSEASCTIYGMPKSVEEMGVHHEVIDLEHIADFIVEMGRHVALYR